MRAVLLDFFPGHGGDFLSTLYGCCNLDCVSTNTSQEIDDTSNIIQRMSEQNPKMPGANWGTKILYVENDQDFESWKQKAKELKFEWDNTKSIVTFGTHSDAQEDPLAYDLIKKHYDMEIDVIVPVPSTPESAAWIQCYEGDHNKQQQYVGPHQVIAKMTRRIKRYDEMNAKVKSIDHIDLLLNDPDELLDLCSVITTPNMNRDLQMYVVDAYTSRVIRFKQWYKRWAHRERFENDFKSTVDNLVK